MIKTAKVTHKSHSCATSIARRPSFFPWGRRPWKYNWEKAPYNLKFTISPRQNGTISQAQVCCIEREINQTCQNKSKTKKTAEHLLLLDSPIRSQTPQGPAWWRGPTLNCRLSNVPRITWQEGLRRRKCALPGYVSGAPTLAQPMPLKSGLSTYT